MHPDIIVKEGQTYKRNSVLRWGPPKCFCERDLYTTKLGDWESTEIEEMFFGEIDSLGRIAVDIYADFKPKNINKDTLKNLVRYMSVQKLRTPKGLAYLTDLIKESDKNIVLRTIQELQDLYGALWAECIWSIADASESETKFILSDHPVTVYNQKCFPGSKWCRDFRDPEISLSGTHTIFPLSFDKILILTNLSWIRNHYGNPLEKRPNPNLFRPAIFDFTQLQKDRFLSTLEVNEINFTIKKRAFRYIAAAKEEWLYPEHIIRSTHWDKLGHGNLYMPDPRLVKYTSEIMLGYGNKVDSFDAYGRKPWQPDYKSESDQKNEIESFHAFMGEFARIFGPKRRGRVIEFEKADNNEDSSEYHEYLIGLERKYKQKQSIK